MSQTKSTFSNEDLAQVKSWSIPDIQGKIANAPESDAARIKRLMTTNPTSVEVIEAIQQKAYEEAGIKSLDIIDGYHFLVSIAPETREANLQEYGITTSESNIVDFYHKSMLLEISFADGTTYEYFGVNEKLFRKFVNTDHRYRFAKRKFFNSFLYRKSKKDTVMA